MQFATNLSYPSEFNFWNQKLEMKRSSNRPTKRTTFTPDQVTLLELEFAKNEYICKDRRSDLARIIDLSECQVKTWFQNRRTKKRRCQTPVKKEPEATSKSSISPNHQNLQFYMTQWIQPQQQKK